MDLTKNIDIAIIKRINIKIKQHKKTSVGRMLKVLRVQVNCISTIYIFKGLEV